VIIETTVCSYLMEDIHREATWKIFIERQISKSTVPSSSPIQDLNVKLVKIYDMKLILNSTCLYMKSTIGLFLFELKQSVEHYY